MTANGLIVNKVLRMQDAGAKRLGLDRLDEDALILGFARWAEGQLKRWLDFAKGALLFVMVPDDPESGMFYIYDRARQTFWMVDPAEVPRYGGYRLDEFEQMAQVFGLKRLAAGSARARGDALRRLLKSGACSVYRRARRQQPMDHRLPATTEMAREFSGLFVNRRAYALQSMRPHPDSGRHYYYRPKPKEGGEPVELTLESVRRHLAGEITIGIYAVNPATQRCKWVAIDADYKTALEDLVKLQRQLQEHGVEAALEKSKRGGHLWIFFEKPVLAREARIYIYHVASKLEVQIKGAGLAEGIEIFPKQDELRPHEFGNAIRAPLGVHRGARDSRGWRYWYYGADYRLESQLSYLKGLRKVSEEHLRRMIAGKEIPQEFAQRARRAENPKYFESRPGEFRILNYVEVRRQAGRNWVARCPSCAADGRDKSGDNLAISVEEPRKYCCWAGCTKEMIRAALGRPIPVRRLA